MILNRRTLLAAASGLAVWPALAQDASPALEAPALKAYERDSGGRIGLYAENLASGAVIRWRADERFVMCSTFKASLAAFTLARVDRGQDQLSQMIDYGPADLMEYAPVAKQNLAKQNLATQSPAKDTTSDAAPPKGMMSVNDMCAAAVELSDNTCANLLLARAGGPEALTAFWRSTGDTVSRLDHNEPLLNRSTPGDLHDTTTPVAMAGNLRRFVLGDVLSPPSRQRLVDWMVACKTGGKRLRAGLPNDWKIADKTGNNGADASSDVAVAWPGRGGPVVVCAYTQGGSPTAPQFETVFAAIGRMVGERLG